MEGRLHESPLPEPEIPVADHQAVPQHRPEHFDRIAFLKILVVLLEHMAEECGIARDDKFPEQPDFESIAALVEPLPQEMQRIAGKADRGEQAEFANLEFGNSTHWNEH